VEQVCWRHGQSYLRTDGRTVTEKNVGTVDNGARGGVVVKALRYKPAGRGFRFPMVSLEFFSDKILPVAL